MSTSIGAVRDGSGASGISALRPLPSAGRLSIISRLRLAIRRAYAARRASISLRERHVGRGAARLHVVQHAGHAVARRLAQPNVARNDRVEHLLLEELADVARHLLAEIRAFVVHRQQHAFDVERRIERAAHAAHRADELGEPFEREVLAVQRNQHGVGRDQRVQRQQAERRRTVDEDVVELVRGGAQRRSRPSRSGSGTISISAPVRSRSAGRRWRRSTSVEMMKGRASVVGSSDVRALRVPPAPACPSDRRHS